MKLKKLESIINDLKVGKELYNEFGSYKYRSAEQILNTVKPLCSKYGVIIRLDCCLPSENMLECRAAAVDVESGEQIADSTAFVKVPDTKKGMDSCQIWGAATSYVRKYALSGLLLIDDGVDNDTEPEQAEETTLKSLYDKFVVKYGAAAKVEMIKACGGVNPRTLSKAKLLEVEKCLVG